MELHDVVDQLVALDDEQRALTNEVNRILDLLEAALHREGGLGLPTDRLSSVEDQLAFGLNDSAALESLSTDLEATVIAVARRGLDELSSGGSEAAERYLQRLAVQVAKVRRAVEDVGRLRSLLGRRENAARQLDQLRRDVGDDSLTAELLEVVLAARDEANEQASHDSRAFLLAAERAAEDDGLLAGLAANVRALREALSRGEDAGHVAEDLGRRILDLSFQLGQLREDLRRRLAALSREAERRQEISAGLFQAVTKASAVLDLAGQLEATVAAGALEDGALGPLKAACLEHGIITLLLELRGLRLDRSELDAAVETLSSALGDVFTLCQGTDHTEELAGVWQDLASVDAGAIEEDWERCYAEVLGVRRDRGGVLSVTDDDLRRLAGADGLEPWLDQLVARLDEKTTSVAELVGRLEGADRVLSELIEEGPPSADAAARAKGALAHFVAAVDHAIRDYYGRLRSELQSPHAGFRRVQTQVAAFAHAEALTPSAGREERREAFSSTLAEVKALFTELESSLPAGTNATQWREAEETARAETAGARRSLATTLARLRRLRGLLIQPVSEGCRDALALAREIREDPERATAELGETVVDRLGEALEALFFAKAFQEHLDLSGTHDILAETRRESDRRLLDLHGASLTLLFSLVTRLGDEYEELEDPERPSHLSWIEELLAHGRTELTQHVQRLETCLFALTDNAERLDRYGQALEAYHAWASRVSELEVGHDLIRLRGQELFAQLERPLGELGSSAIQAMDVEAADWRSSSHLETLIELYRQLERDLERRPTVSNLGERVRTLRERAEALRSEISRRVEEEDDTVADGRRAIFR